MASRIRKENDRAVVIAMLDLKRTAKGPVSGILGDWLVARAKLFWPWYAGFKWFSRTNVPWRWNMLAYHHPAQLCWEWFWSFSINRSDVRWRHPKHWLNCRMQYGRARLVVPFLFEISFVRQDYGYMLSSTAEQRLRAYGLGEQVQP